MNMMEMMDTKIDELTSKIAGDLVDYPRGVTPRETIYKAGKMSLVKFSGDSEPLYDTPFLFVPSLINRWYILDVTEGTSFIKFFTELFPCYMIDWGYPGVESGKLTLSHYYHKCINRAVRQIKKETGVSKVNMLGYCIGGTLAYAYSCLEPDKVDKLILLTAPIDFTDVGVLSKYAKDFPVDEAMDAMEYMPGWLLAQSFQFIQPLGNLQKTKLFHKKCEDEKFRELYVAMERWISDPVNFPAKSYTELIKDLYNENKLSQGELFTKEGIMVDPSKRTCDCLILNATKDHIAPGPSTKLPETDTAPVSEVTFNTGHIGITTGRAGTDAKNTIRDFIIEK